MGLHTSTAVSTVIDQRPAQNNLNARDLDQQDLAFDAFIERSAPHSRISDLSGAEETSSLALQRVLQSPSIAVLAQANAKPDKALQLMR